MEGKIAVLGGTDFVMPFSALGVDTYPVGLTAGDIAENGITKSVPPKTAILPSISSYLSELKCEVPKVIRRQRTTSY